MAREQRPASALGLPSGLRGRSLGAPLRALRWALASSDSSARRKRHVSCVHASPLGRRRSCGLHAVASKPLLDSKALGRTNRNVSNAIPKEVSRL
mmetsp:Transcript_15751/g.47362  ORF Transcript_15751/g.47362 Transcript_15751/m.47362 type:complete len:95 (-) Transcript_15751:75-359(-)